MKVLISFLLINFLLLISGCYPISVRHGKWKIKWDKEMMQGREDYLAKKHKRNNDAPNVIFIVCDDLGKYEVSAYGAEHIQTPNIDQLGNEGVIFTEGYVTAPTCASSRAGIMTGRVQNRYGFETQIMEHYPTNMIEYLSGKGFIDTGDWVMTSKPEYPSEWQTAKQGVPPTEINMAELLQAHGYNTAITGKWHLGAYKNIPTKRGFEYQYGFIGAFSLYTPEEKWNKVVNYRKGGFSTNYQWETGRYGEAAIMENDKEIEEEEYLTFAIKDKAIDYIKKQQENEDPFFLYLTFSAPHIPFQAPVEYYCKYLHIEEENKRVYYAMISALDDSIGEINQTLKALGIEENTIVFLLSDNGGATYTGATDNGPLKGGKLTHFEGGINVPFMMKWKGHIPEGKRYDKPVLSTDMYTTVVNNIGGELPQDRVYDGVDLVKYLNREIDGDPHPQLFWRVDHIWAIRDGDYKMILSTRDGWAELYNLKTDKSEKINLNEEMPELMEQLKAMHLQWQNDNLPEKPLWPRIMDHKFVFYGKEYLFPA